MAGLRQTLKEALHEANQDNRPPTSPSKKAEQYWPTSACRPDLAAAWPPFCGHRIPLGGDRR